MAHKLALVGIGKIARDQHIPAISENSGWELAATASRNASVEGVQNFRDIETMLKERPDIGIISLAIPPQPRFAYAAAAINARRHVMLEKPPGETLAECHRLIDMAKTAGVSLYATWHSRHAHGVSAAKEWLRERRIERVEVIWKEDVRRWHPGQEWIWEAGGLGVFDPGINALSIVTEILPEPIFLQSATLEFPENRDTPIAASLTLLHQGGAIVSAEFDWRQEGPQTWDIEIATDSGLLKLSAGGAKLAIDGKPVAEGPDREYAALYQNMLALVDAGKSDVDLAPMIHVADAFMLGRRMTVAPFFF